MAARAGLEEFENLRLEPVGYVETMQNGGIPPEYGQGAFELVRPTQSS